MGKMEERLVVVTEWGYHKVFLFFEFICIFPNFLQ